MLVVCVTRSKHAIGIRQMEINITFFVTDFIPDFSFPVFQIYESNTKERTTSELRILCWLVGPLARTIANRQ